MSCQELMSINLRSRNTMHPHSLVHLLFEPLPKALENVSKAIEATPNAFWMLIYKAKIQKEMGDTAGALESSKLSMAAAKEAKNDDYVRMNEKFQKELKN